MHCLAETHTRSGGSRANPVPHQACAVFYNPTYRFIYVRNRKTASTTFLDMLRRALPPQLRGKVKPAIRMFPDRLQVGCCWSSKRGYTGLG